MLHIVRYLLQNGARPAINHGKNSALACVLRQVRYTRRIVNIEANPYDFYFPTLRLTYGLSIHFY